jgi:ATP-dependent DNA helicase RecG
LSPGNIQIRIFDDRLEIWSPGLLPKELNIKSLLAENRSIPRNRGLAKIFHDIGFVEGWKTGLQRMVEGCNMNGNPKPELKKRIGEREKCRQEIRLYKNAWLTWKSCFRGEFRH